MIEGKLNSNSFLQVLSNDDISRQVQEREESERPQEHSLEGLAAHISKCFSDAENHRSATSAGSGDSITNRLLASQRQRHGVYAQEILAKIRETGGSDMYFNITGTKCEAAEAWARDILAPLDDKPWSLEATPIPDLPEDVKQNIIEIVTRQFSGVQNPMPEEVREITLRIYDEAMAQQKEDAEERATRMEERMEDQLVEGGWFEALYEFLTYLFTYQIAVIKGPVLRKRKRLKWVNGEIATVEEIIPTWCSVSPHDFYPGPNARNTQTSYICERVSYDKSVLSSMRGTPGWSTEEIDAVLSENASQQSLPLIVGDTDRRDLENKNVNNEGQDSTIDGIEYWGSAKGSDLMEWGLGGDGGVTDANAYYEICGILIGRHVVRATLNPDRLGHRPYFATSFVKVPGSIWGQSLPEKMADCQDGENGAMRHLMNNMALASGPMLGYDIDAMPDGFDPTTIIPWKVFQYHGRKSGGKAIDFFQPNMNVVELQSVAEYFDQKADDRTLIPRYAHGNENVTGAGETAAGLSMLMNAASKGIKKVISNIDHDILRPMISMLYAWNLVYLKEPELKGDCRVVPRGAMAMIVREQTQLRRQEFLDRTNNPTDMAIIGMRGRAELLRAAAKSLDMPTDKIVPDEEELMQQMQMQQQQEEPDASAPQQ